ncbi:amino acid adenylation domain-containing protein [Saccharopolyspora lacisalsi]|uniref:Amino acid adenylation domain-containing protein n=1 Tax=Halosaccharopolyspora lacisalsi TaxID=1000566 RepID=A0A839DUX4_9PSEU|nr:non-ribosomal peptide synthetase [Halosaccharopolyspora lacisalsi]MBA8822961.1 amino acid adenylation domain-containing protein [Halosaccharopolyspora lacisalsi]
MSSESVRSVALTPAQSGIWYGRRLNPADPTYTIAEYLDVPGPIDPEILERALERTAAEVPALRLTFDEDEQGRPRQTVGSVGRWGLRTVDLSGSGDFRAAAEEWMHADLRRPIDPVHDELCSLVLFTAGERHSLLYQRTHHLVVDGYGAALVLSRITAVYTALNRGEQPPEPRLGDFGELLEAEAAYPETSRHEQDRQFWTQRLADRPDPVVLSDRPAATGPILRRSVSMDGAATRGLRTAAAELRTAWSSVVLAAMAAYVHRTTGAQDVVLALPVSARKGTLGRETPAMLSQVLPLRVRVHQWMTVAELVSAVSAEARRVLRHQRYPRSDLARDLGVTAGERITGPGINIIPVAREVPFGEATATSHNLSVGPVDDLTVTVHGAADDNGLRLDFDANPGRYEQRELEAHAERFRRVLDTLISAPDAPVGSVSPLDERPDPAPSGGDVTPRHATVVEAFESAVAGGPGSTALVSESGTLSFEQLNARANRLARELITTGVGVGDVVAVLLPRSADVVAALLAVFKAGAVHLPVDPGQPASRVADMVADARPVAAVTTADTRASLPDGLAALCLDDPDTAASIAERDEHDVTIVERGAPVSSDHAAYLLFTSGSTGRPKGVLVEHGSLANLLESHRERVYEPAGSALGRRLRAAHTAPLSFDASWDPLLWMFAGHELHLVSDAVRRDSEALVAELDRQRWDALETTPSHLRELLRAGLLDQRHRPRVLALGGEPFDQDLWTRLAAEPDLDVHNFYGPTETTVDSVVATTDDADSAVIGRPTANLRAYVLDTALQPVQPGVTGELYIAGAGLARGYLGRTVATAEKFVADPFTGAGQRMYRTGDLVRRDERGLLSFVSRADEQLKFRGMRIEPGEISAVLGERPEVDRAAVTVRSLPDGPQRLVAYVTPAPPDGTQPPEDAPLREFLADRLPEYMVPSAVVVLDELPLTAHGKLDVAALPDPRPATGGRAARDDVERRLGELFAEVLGVDAVGIDDDFFALGGHSLLVTRLAARVRGELGAELELRALFENPTVAALAPRLRGLSSPVLGPRERPDELPLSHAQRRLWLLNHVEGTGGAYHIPIALRMHGEPDVAALRLALGDVVARHESLRTVFPGRDGIPRQEVLDPADGAVSLPVHDTDEEHLREELDAFAAEPFDLTREIPLRTRLFALGSEESVLVVVLHHIAGDGWSLRPLMADLSLAYAARSSGTEPAPEPLPLQYADYTLWQREVLGDDADPDSEFGAQLDFWTETLGGSPEELELPTDRPRPARPSHRGGTVPVDIDAATHRALHDLAREAGASPFMALHAALAATLTRMGAGTDVPIGTPVAARNDERLGELVGFFVNTLVLRTDTSGDPSFRTLLGRTRETDLDAYAHQDVPFERVVEAVAPHRSPARHPLFQVMLALQNAPAATVHLPGLRAEVEAEDLGRSAKFDLSLSLRDDYDEAGSPAGLVGSLEFSSDLFDPATAEHLVRRFVLLLRSAIAEPDTPIGDVELVDAVERRRLLDEYNDTGRPVGVSSIVEAFHQQAARTPSAVALVAADGALSFSDLDARANRLARHLITEDVRSGDVVALALGRGARAVVALLAAAKAGAVLLPVDPSQPTERTVAVFTDAVPRRVLTTGAHAAALPVEDPLVLDDPVVEAAVSARSGERLDPEQWPLPGPCDAAYVLFTSGSTGRPKGVLVEHGSLANLLTQHRDRMIEPAVERVGGRRLRVGHTAPLSFDASWDPLLWMCAGHELHLLDDPLRRDAEAFTGEVVASGLDVLETTPSFVWQLVHHGLLEPGRHRPTVLALGGEPVDERLWRHLRTVEGMLALNFYGPTETTVDSVVAALGDAEHPVIGEPVANTRAYVLDERLRPVPAGVGGELYLSGHGLARGYLGRGDRTAERFVADPFAADGRRMYRTGDRARWTPEGSLRFLGRTDDQVKLRGFRIELGEIGSALGTHPSVERAAAVVRGEDAADQRLVGYFVSRDHEELDIPELRAFLARRLPGYMVPSALVELAELPLTANGKLDTRALPVPAADGNPTGRAPRDPREEILCGLFAEVLGVSAVGVDDDFFDLGGHSLLATRMVSRIRSALGAELEIRALFENPTVAGLSGRIERTRRIRTPLRPMQRPDPLPLSYAQQRLWFLNRLEEHSAGYNIAFVVRLSGPVDAVALHRALGDVVDRHETLRTVFPDRNGTPHQHVLDDGHPELPVVSVTEDELRPALEAEASTGFDVATETPLRARLFTVAPERHVLSLVLHHIAGDGWSTGPLARDLSRAYTARVAGEAPQGAAPSVQYADYALWQRTVLGSEDDPDGELRRQLDFWTSRLEDLPGELPLPTDRRRPAEAGYCGGQVPLDLGAARHARLEELARDHGVSTFMVLQAALAALLTRLGAGTDVPIGSPVAGRTDEALEELVGFFVNTLVLRTDTSGDPAFTDLLARVRETDLDAYAHQDLPFERLVEALSPDRSLARHPLFQVMLTLDNTPDVGLRLPSVDAEVTPIESGGAKFDLSVSFRQRHDADGTPGGIAGSLEYSADLFDHGTAERIGVRLLRLLDGVLERPRAPIGAVELLDEQERHEVLVGHNDTALPVGEDTVVEAFHATVRATPTEAAVVDAHRSLTFAELNLRANRLARELLARGHGGRVVGVALPRSVDAVVALLAVAKAGSTYLPIDPAQPGERIRAMLDDAAPSTVLTGNDSDVALGDADRTVLDEPGTAWVTATRDGRDVTDAERGAAIRPTDAAYVLFTSGSTGRPKGVVVEHGSLANLLANHRRRLFGTVAGRRMRVGHTAPLSFDASWDPLLWMVDGHELHLFDDRSRRDPERVVHHVRTHRVDVLESTSSYVQQLLSFGLLDESAHRPSLIALGGEAVGAELWRTLRSSPVTAVNLYGPTESTVDSVLAGLDEADHPVIGTPAANTRAYVLDAGLRPTPPGVTGELHLAGAGLARGYLGRADLTAERFVADPFSGDGSRMYRTGDLARWNTAGQLEFVGRDDDQLKVRGQRVEPGEVVAVLNEHPAVAESAVFVEDDRLVAYVAVHRALDPDEVRTFVGRRLPAHMVPALLRVLDSLPLTANGKLDTRALARATATELTSSRQRRGPRTPQEHTLVGLFAEVLGLDEVGIDDDFFALGGHSLVATKLVSRIRSALGVELSIRALFDASTPATLAERLGVDTGDDALDVLLPLRAGGSKPPLFCVHPAGGLSWMYSGLVTRVDPDRPIYGLQARGIGDPDRAPADIDEMARDYAARIREVQPRGPYCLLGWSFGGNVVQTVAAQLRDQGEEVALLAVLDAYPVEHFSEQEHDGETDLFTSLVHALGIPAEALSDNEMDATELRRTLERVGNPLGSLDEGTLRAMAVNFEHQARLLKRHSPGVFDGDVLFFTATEEGHGTRTPWTWRPYVTGEITEHLVHCGHAQMAGPEALDEIGPVLDAALTAASDDTARASA